jgi:hydroxyacylglutathione hydrolase
MRQIRPDLWETPSESPFEGLTTHAYLWTPPAGGNVLFYSTVTDAEHDEIARLGGVEHHYLSHRDEAGPMLAAVGERFGAVLHVAAVEADDAARFRQPGATFSERHVDASGIEVIPTPGHTPGSACYVVPGEGGARYLFTGDTIFVGDDGHWYAGLLPFSDRDDLVATLELLATLEPDLVASSAAPSGAGAHELDRPWRDCVEEALAALPVPR